MGREVAQLAGFIDQAGLFRTLGPVTNKLHFSALPCGFFTYLQAYWNSAGGIATHAPALPQCSTLILRRPRSGRLEGWPRRDWGLMVRDGAPRLLTMRVRAQ